MDLQNVWLLMPIYSVVCLDIDAGVVDLSMDNTDQVGYTVHEGVFLRVSTHSVGQSGLACWWSLAPSLSHTHNISVCKKIGREKIWDGG